MPTVDDAHVHIRRESDQRALRILQIIETGGPGGAETVFAQLATGLRDRGHEVFTIVGEGSWLPQEMRRRGFTPHVVPRSARSVGSFVTHVASTIRREQIGVVHAHLFDGSMYASFAARLTGTPIISTLHGQVDLRHGGVKQRSKHLLFRAFVTHVVAVSEALKRDLQPTLKLRDERFSVVHNGLERSLQPGVPTGRPDLSASAVRPFRLIAVGNIRPAKDYGTLLGTVRILLDRGLNVMLDVVGQPDSHGLYEQLLSFCATHRLENAVCFRGFLADPAPVLSTADVFVLASSKEGFSLATIEAMAAGIPVVATRSGGPEEIIRHEETGILVPTQDSAALADAIEALLRNPARREHLAAMATVDVRHRFSVQHMVSSYERLYLDCLLVG